MSDTTSGLTGGGARGARASSSATPAERDAEREAAERDTAARETAERAAAGRDMKPPPDLTMVTCLVLNATVITGPGEVFGKGELVELARDEAERLIARGIVSYANLPGDQGREVNVKAGPPVTQTKTAT
jgi:hypothetical protein